MLINSRARKCVCQVFRISQGDVEAFTDDRGGTFEGFEGNGGVVGVEEAIEGGATGAHGGGHLGLGEFLFLHFLLKLPNQNPLEGSDPDFF